MSQIRWSIGKHHYEPEWFKVNRQLQYTIPRELQCWILDSGSLTERLKSAAKGQLQVRVIDMCHERPMWSERQALNIADQQVALVRHVLLSGCGQPWVFARTVIPLASLGRSLKHLKRLGNRPLGAVLFSDKNLFRSELEVTACSSRANFFNKINVCSQNFSETEAIWGRRSLFKLKGQPLLVSEFFLPGIYGAIP